MDRPRKVKRKAQALKPAPLLVALVQTRIVKPQSGVHTVRENCVLQSAGMQPGTAGNFVKELPRHTIQSGIDQVIDVWHSLSVTAHVVNEIAGIDAIGL